MKTSTEFQRPGRRAVFAMSAPRDFRKPAFGQVFDADVVDRQIDIVDVRAGLLQCDVRLDDVPHPGQVEQPKIDPVVHPVHPGRGLHARARPPGPDYRSRRRKTPSSRFRTA